MSSSVSPKTGKRACSELRTRSTTSLHGVPSSMPTMSTRGTMMSRTEVSVSEKTPWRSACSSRETSASAATTCRNCSAASSSCSARSATVGGGRSRSKSAVERDPRAQDRREHDLQQAHQRRELDHVARRGGEAQRPREALDEHHRDERHRQHREHAAHAVRLRELEAARQRRPGGEVREDARQRERAVRALAAPRDRRRRAELARGRGRPRAARRPRRPRRRPARRRRRRRRAP